MSEELTPYQPQTPAEIMERVIVVGDLSKLTPSERVGYYRAVCDSIGLNPLTKPFDYITLNGKLTLYAKKDATDQLRNIRRVSTRIVSREKVDDLYVVTARASTPDGREDEDIGAVNIAGLRGDALANAMMKAGTKAKRRVTLSLCGLGLLDETELETIPDARPVLVSDATGEIVSPPVSEQRPAAQTTRINGKTLTPAELKAAIAAKVARYAEKSGDAPAATDAHRALMSVMRRRNISDEGRHQLLGYLLGKDSSQELTAAETQALTDWLTAERGDATMVEIDQAIMAVMAEAEPTEE